LKVYCSVWNGKVLLNNWRLMTLKKK
jgi:hypothetical protein